MYDFSFYQACMGECMGANTTSSKENKRMEGNVLLCFEGCIGFCGEGLNYF